VRSRFIVVANVIFQNLTQMYLAQDNDVAHTFTPEVGPTPPTKPGGETTEG
jgi:hypothetical protein